MVHAIHTISRSPSTPFVSFREGRIIPHGCYGVLLFFASVSRPAFKWFFRLLARCFVALLGFVFLLSCFSLPSCCHVTRWLGDDSLVVPSPSRRDSCVSSCFDLLYVCLLLICCCQAGLVWPSGRCRLTACVPARRVLISGHSG